MADVHVFSLFGRNSLKKIDRKGCFRHKEQAFTPFLFFFFFCVCFTTHTPPFSSIIYFVNIKVKGNCEDDTYLKM